MFYRVAALLGLCVLTSQGRAFGGDLIRDLQLDAATTGKAEVAHWGPDPAKYISWSSHSLRPLPVYTFGTKGQGPGIDLNSYVDERSVYRDPAALASMYDRMPTNSIHASASYLDQSQIASIQRAAMKAGKKHIFLVVFDGTDWHITRAAAIYNSQRVGYTEGRGTGLHLLDYTADGTTQFGSMITAPHNSGTKVEINLQRVTNPGGTHIGGYNLQQGGQYPWSNQVNLWYLIGKTPQDKAGEHPVPDSAATATAMCCGVKTYNEAIGVDENGLPIDSVAHELQREGYSIGVVTSVILSHATPASTYSHNVTRDDYQDISRDLLGRHSVFHRRNPLPGVDVLIGTGHGSRSKPEDLEKHRKEQGENFEPGNLYLADSDLFASALENGGRYVVAERTAGRSGRELLLSSAQRAAAGKHRLLGYFGIPGTNHLPFRTADGNFDPVRGKDAAKIEKYTPADLTENPTLADMAEAALTVLSKNPNGFWMMLEAGDVDWANHDNNLDNSIGAVLSGDAAVKVITDWVEKNSNWQESVMIITGDHGHLLTIDRPELLISQ